MEQHSFHFQKTARFFSSKTITGKESEIWIVLHGYRQLAKHFLKKFPRDLGESVLLVAPEGMHRFYIEGYSGRVGASWMTSEEREADIQDYIEALDTFVEGLLKNYQDKPRLNVLGFSQGGATALRWICNSRFTYDNLIVWAGSLPKDIDYSTNLSKLNALNIKILIGDKDEFIDKKKIVNLEEFLEKENVKYELIPYEGNHTIYPDVFRKVISYL